MIEQVELQQIAALDIDITEGHYRPNVYLETDLSASQISQLKNQAIPYEVLIDDVTQF